MAAPDTDLFKDKIEVSLDGRQIFYLFFGGAVIATLVFVLGVMVGRRVEARALVETGSPVTDPLAALDRMEGSSGLAFPTALRGDDQVMLGAVDESLARRTQALKPATGGPLKAEPAASPIKADDKAEVAPAKKAEPEAKVDPAPKAAAAVAAKPDHAAEAETEAQVVLEDDANENDANESDANESDAKSASKRRFTLQVGSFQDKAEADQFFRELAASSYAPYMVEADVPGKGKYYRVRVGGYASFEEAIDAKGTFEEGQHVIAYVTRLK